MITACEAQMDFRKIRLIRLPAPILSNILLLNATLAENSRSIPKSHMRTFTYCLLVSFALLSFGCKKDSKRTSTGLTGAWIITGIQGGMMPFYQPTGDDRETLIFENDSYTWKRGNTVIGTGSYTVIADADMEKEVCLVNEEGKYSNRIEFAGTSIPYKVYFAVTADKLELVYGCFALDYGTYKVFERASSY